MPQRVLSEILVQRQPMRNTRKGTVAFCSIGWSTDARGSRAYSSRLPRQRYETARWTQLMHEMKTLFLSVVDLHMAWEETV